MWSKPRTHNSQLSVSNVHVEKRIRERFREFHVKRLGAVRAKLDQEEPSSLKLRHLRRGGKKARRKKEEEKQIRKDNKDLQDKIKSMNISSIRSKRRPGTAYDVYRSHLAVTLTRRMKKLNRANRALSRRLRKAHFPNSYCPKSHLEKKRPTSQRIVSRTRAFAVRSAWGAQMRSVVSCSPTKGDIRRLRETYSVDGSLPRSKRGRRTERTLMPTSADIGQSTSRKIEGSALLYSDSRVHRSLLSGYDGHRDVLLGSSKRVHIEAPGCVTSVPESKAHEWSLYLFDVASSTNREGVQTTTKGVRIRAIRSESRRGRDGTRHVSQDLFLSMTRVRSICKDESCSQRLRDILSDTCVRLCAAATSESNVCEELLRVLRRRLRYFRGRIWLVDSIAWNRAMASASALNEKETRDAKIFSARYKTWRENQTRVARQRERRCEKMVATHREKTRREKSNRRERSGIATKDRAPQTSRLEETQSTTSVITNDPSECIYRGIVNVDGRRLLLRMTSKRSMGTDATLFATDAETGNQTSTRLTEHDVRQISDGHASGLMTRLFGPGTGS